MYIPIDVAAVGTAVGKNRNCPLFGSRNNWNGTGGGNTDSIGTGAEISNKQRINLNKNNNNNAEKRITK